MVSELLHASAAGRLGDSERCRVQEMLKAMSTLHEKDGFIIWSEYDAFWEVWMWVKSNEGTGNRRERMDRVSGVESSFGQMLVVEFEVPLTP